MKNINEMFREEFEMLPHRKWNEEIRCDSIIILPSKVPIHRIILFRVQYWLSKKCRWVHKPEIYEVPGMHDSGYRCMDFVAVKDNRWAEKYGGVPETIPPAGWSIDCLRTSGLLRMWPSYGKQIICGMALSSFEIFAETKIKEEYSENL